MVNKDKYIVERLGHCWHTYNPLEFDYPFHCSGCHVPLAKPPNENIDLTTWEGFGWLWEEIERRDDWEEFKGWLSHGYTIKVGVGWIFDEYFINPTRFRDAVYDFLKGQGDEHNNPS